MAHGLPKAELDAARALFVERMYAEAEAAGRKLPADFRSQLKGKTPLRDAWNGMVSRSSNRGHPGGSPVDPAWEDKITGFLAFAFAMGPRPYQGKAGLARPDTSKPWGPGNARWAKPPKPRSVLTETPAELKAMAPSRRARVAALIATRRAKDGSELRPEYFERHKKNWLYVLHWDMHERMYDPGDAPAQNASAAAWKRGVRFQVRDGRSSGRVTTPAASVDDVSWPALVKTSSPPARCFFLKPPDMASIQVVGSGGATDSYVPSALESTK